MNKLRMYVITFILFIMGFCIACAVYAKDDKSAFNDPLLSKAGR